jgi:hypothetical protein
MLTATEDPPSQVDANVAARANTAAPTATEDPPSQVDANIAARANSAAPTATEDPPSRVDANVAARATTAAAALRWFQFSKSHFSSLFRCYPIQALA